MNGNVKMECDKECAVKRVSGLSDDALVEFQNASFSVGGNIVFPDTAWKIRKGEQWGIVGPNGSGKAILVQAILGEIMPTSGSVSYNLMDSGGRECDPPDAIAMISTEKQREFIRKESSFYQSRWHSGIEEGEHTVSDYLSQKIVEDINPFAVDARMSDPDEFESRRQELIKALNIADLLSRKILHLSNGEQRKVLLAHALLRKPQILILDDPFAGLDSDSRSRVSGLLMKLKKSGLTMILISHRLNEISRFISNLLIVRDYRVIAAGEKSAVVRKIGRAGVSDVLVSVKHGSKTILPIQKMPAVKTVIKVQNLSILAGDKIILDSINWTVRAGEHWAISGRNGSGKTTLLNVICGDHPQAFAQDITLFDKRLARPQDFVNARRKIGVFTIELHQHFPLECNCLDAVCSGFYNTPGLFKTPSSEHRKRAKSLLEDFGLEHYAKTPLCELPVGHQRLVLICRAMVRMPWLLILDEPCQGLDALQKITVLKAVDRIAEQTKATILFVTHHPREMPQCITHILKIKDGKSRAIKRR